MSRPKTTDVISLVTAHEITNTISTGKLEGFNNKIKVSKRIGYGYRDDEYFFTLIRFISIPKSNLFHGKP